MTTNIRHINRGDIREGGCAMCKPRHKRFGSWTQPKDLLPMGVGAVEGLEDFMDEVEDHIHTPEEEWDFGV